MKAYLEAIQSLSESTDDYLYLWDIEADKIQFFGDISKKYNLMSDGKPYCTVEEWMENVYSKDIPGLKEGLGRIIRGEKTVYDMDYRLIDRDGNCVWVSCRGTVVKPSKNSSPILIGRVSDTALRYKIDPLTGMFNSVKMKEDIERELSTGQDGFLLILGVDSLKNINIKHGYEIGNQVLKILAEVLEEVTVHKAYRLERDYFALCLLGAAREEVRDIYSKIQENVLPHFTVSGGAVTFSSVPDKENRTLYQYAEYALDKAKEAGKNRLVFFTEAAYQKEISSIELLEEMKSGVRNGCNGFFLVYQPQIKAESYQLFGAEALLRYSAPFRGQIMPDEFIPLLEGSGLICEIGLWTLRTALNQCREWRKKMPEFHISVNISYVQLAQKDIKEKVLEILEESGVPGKALTLEVTESMQLQNFEYYNEIFHEWRNAGIEISVDDFGTGYSSLGYLKHLKVDEIKIDRCFVSGIQNSSYNYRLLFNMLEFTTNAQIRVCCEGVEEKEELQVLEELGSDLLQGYLFSKPYDAEQFERIHFQSGNPEYQEYRRRIGQVQKKYFGKLLNIRHRDILKATNLGLWIIRVNEADGCNELYADETMLRVLGADRNLSPEECYQFWYDRIRQDCYEYVDKSVNRMITSGGIVQLQYAWNHPELGEVDVRCTGIRTGDIDGMICLEGYHRVVSNIEMTWLQE